MTGALGTPSDKVIGLIASNFNIAGLAGLLNLDWLAPGYQADVAAPGGALVFELRQSLTDRGVRGPHRLYHTDHGPASQSHPADIGGAARGCPGVHSRVAAPTMRPSTARWIVL